MTSNFFLPAAEHLCVFVWNLHVSELGVVKGFGEVRGEKTIVMRMRVVVIHCKLNTASGLTGWGENVDVGDIL